MLKNRVLQPVAFPRVLIPACALLAACTPDGGGTPRTTRSDTGSVQVVDNAEGKWRSGEEWIVAEAPVLEIGSDERPEHQFHGIVGAVRLSDGRIAIGDGGSSQVRLFGPRGELMGVVGRRGGGPEEFLRMTRLLPLPGDSLVVFDAGARRVSVLTSTGAQGRLVTLTMAGPGSELAGVLDNGSYVLGNTLPVPPGEGLARDSVLYLLVRPDGSAADTLGIVPGGQRYQRTTGGRVSRLSVPFGVAAAATARGDLVFTGATDRYEIRQYRPEDGALRLIRRPVPPQPFTDAHYNEVLEGFPQFRPALQEIPRPQHLPAFASLIADRGGNLWVQDYPSPGAATSAWTVFDRDGDMLGAVSLPANFRPTDIGSDYVAGVWMDELGVERVRLYQIRKPRAG